MIYSHIISLLNLGALDGTHIRVDRPKQDPDSYVNRKQYYSIHVQGIVDHNLKFMDVPVGYPGSAHDARVFKESPSYSCLNELCLEDSYLLGDTPYPCLKKLMVPYRDNGHLTNAQKQFNKKLSSCRVVIENAFGNVKQRFKQVYHCKLRDIVRMVKIIHVCFLLHNVANSDDLQLLEPPLNEGVSEELENFHFAQMWISTKMVRT
ncbi:uncharacterized protein [Prorops nasuta]|uniref:uncharacterized protein n=1 Tax=Prorops nasuta TaxID=863751 RepID=UPI0034CD594B